MPPAAPPSLPTYLAEGLPKQDDEALREAREYIDALLNVRDQRQNEPVTEDELPEDARFSITNQAALCISNIGPAATKAVRV